MEEVRENKVRPFSSHRKSPSSKFFKKWYGNTTTTLYYHGINVGEARGPPGKAKARRTMRMNVTIDVITDKLLGNPDFMDELLGGKGVVRMDSFSRVPGQVKMLNFIKKHVVVKMNCSSNFSIFTQQMQEMDCKRKVKIW
ncbi:hypothetical protein PIB30_027371 [Stylosanthes scabra]|uniref:Late embryogenesis abundant protein LEA-2 subgroup domain-containing protein n=1 Tax=Stylosanthes scabra TaxID=79078 RepID=A0ABU6SAI0_9FABA|nr:hypothetical protein [Stylosanthes scabra]